MAEFELVPQNEYDAEFKIDKEDLVKIVTKCQERTFSEDVDFIETFGGFFLIYLFLYFSGDQSLLSLLGVDSKKGLNSSTIEARRDYFGSNKTEESPPKSNNSKYFPSYFLAFFEFICNALEDFTLRVLLVAAGVSIVANMIVEKEHREIGNENIS